MLRDTKTSLCPACGASNILLCRKLTGRPAMPLARLSSLQRALKFLVPFAPESTSPERPSRRGGSQRTPSAERMAQSASTRVVPR
jgi:hypothetical protein